MQAPELPDLLTTDEVADLLRVSPRTVARMSREGQIPSIQLPTGTRRYRLADIEGLLIAKGGDQ